MCALGRLCISWILRVCKRRLEKASLIWKTDDDDSDNTFAVMNTQHALTRPNTTQLTYTSIVFPSSFFFTASLTQPGCMCWRAQYVWACTCVCSLYSTVCGAIVCELCLFIFTQDFVECVNRISLKSIFIIIIDWRECVMCVCALYTSMYFLLFNIYIISFGGPFNIKYFLSCRNATENR